MLIRWLILGLCKSRAELRCVMRAALTYMAARHAASPEDIPVSRFSQIFQRGAGQARYRVKDARIRRSPRLALTYAILVVHFESPQLLAVALIAMPVALVMGTLYAAGLLD